MQEDPVLVVRCSPSALIPPFFPFSFTLPSIFPPTCISSLDAHRFAALRIISNWLHMEEKENKGRSINPKEARVGSTSWKKNQSTDESTLNKSRRLVDTHEVCHSCAMPSAIHHRKCRRMNNGRINVAGPVELRWTFRSSRNESASYGLVYRVGFRELFNRTHRTV